jgi:hypothetical protein
MPTSWKGAPMIATPPLTATDVPNESPDVPSLAVSLACSVHSAPLFTNTYAAPAPVQPQPRAMAQLGAPRTAVEPLNDAETPRKSPTAGSFAVSSASWVHTSGSMRSG